MNVLVTTIVALNPGDAAILLGTMRLVQRAAGGDADVAAVDRQAAVAEHLYPWCRFLPSLFGRRPSNGLRRWIAHSGYEHRLRRFDSWRLTLAGRLTKSGAGALARLLASTDELAVLRAYLAADIVLASGGTYLVPQYSMETPLRDYEMTLALGRPLAFMPQSMGPFKGSGLESRFRSVFCRSRFVLVRDEQSRRHLVEIGVPEGLVTVVPDAAFALAPAVGMSGRDPDIAAGIRRVAVSVREWGHFSGGDPSAGEDRYLAGVAALVSWLVKSCGARVTFLSSCQGIPDYWTDDSATARRVLEKLEPSIADQVVVDDAFRGPEELMQALAGFDLVVATRMHVAILALGAEVPVLPIAYEFKTTELFRSLGLADLVTPIEDANEAALVERAQRVLSDITGLRGRIRAGVSTFRERLKVAESRIRECAEAQVIP